MEYAYFVVVWFKKVLIFNHVFLDLFYLMQRMYLVSFSMMDINFLLDFGGRGQIS